MNYICRLCQTKGQVLFEHYAAGLGQGENFGPTWLQLLLNFMQRSAAVRLGWSAKRFSNSEVVLQGHGLFASIHRTRGVRSFPHKAWHGTGYAQNHSLVSSLCMQVSKSDWTFKIWKKIREATFSNCKPPCGRSNVTVATYERDLSRENKNCKWQGKEQCPDEIELNIHAAI